MKFQPILFKLFSVILVSFYFFSEDIITAKADSNLLQNFDVEAIDTAAPASFSKYKGKVVLINLWATWCVPCRVEMPHLDSLAKKFKSSKFQVVALAQKSPTGAYNDFISGGGFKKIKFINDKAEVMAAQKKPYQFGGKDSLPLSFILSKKGRLVGVIRGPRDWSGADAKKVIEHFLKQ